MQTNSKIRNIAIIAHVDHGKTTLVDQMFKQCGLFRDNQEVEDRVMDSMDLERERGITIAAKNCSVYWDDCKINILDTPGHADFGGEVERALNMVDGVILLVDSSEGPLPQTRFVLQKALAANLSIILVINKIDRSDARPEEVINEVYDLFIDLDASEEQLEFPVLYAIGRDGIAKDSLEGESSNLSPLMNQIMETIPAPSHNPEEPFQMVVTDLSYSDYLGQLAIGRIQHGSIRKNDALLCIGESSQKSVRAVKVQTYQGLSIGEEEELHAGDILILAGIDNPQIGDTLCRQDAPRTLPRVEVDDPTISMRFFPNTSPLAGREGKFVQSTKLRDRLHKEALSNVALEVEEIENSESLLVKGRGEFQMAILVETMRREGFELTIGRPEVLYKEEDGAKLEPIEKVYIDCGEEFVGVISEKLAIRKGRMDNLNNPGSGRVRMEFNIPSRGLIGYRNEFLTDTKGTGILSSYLLGYEPHRGNFPTRSTGSLVADRTGKAVAYALFNLEPRGRLFVTPGTEVYEGMLVGEHSRDSDLNVNACKEKKLTNVRASGKDDSVQLTPVLPLTLEQAIEFIREDEVIEVTPQNIRLRKMILSASERQRRR